jgi:hypothetical protein
MSDLFCSTLNELRLTSVSGLDNLTTAYVGTLRSLFIWVNNEGGTDDNQTVITPSNNPPSGRWICPQAPIIPNQTTPWNLVDKTGSKLSDLSIRSATDLDSGTIHYLRLPDGVPYFNPAPPLMILTTDNSGNYQLTHINVSQLDGLVPFGKIDWTNFDPNTIGAESLIVFNPNQFDVDAFNNVSIKLMSNNQAGLAIPGEGIISDTQGRINVIYGTGPSQALEGTTPLGGDLSGEHSTAVVDALRNVPLTFFFNELEDKDGYILRLNSSNHSTPFFYLSPGGSGGNGNVFSIEFNCSTPIAEIGQTVSNLLFNAAYSGTVTSATLTDTLGHSTNLTSPYTSVVSPYSFTENTQTSITFTLSILDSESASHEATTEVSWLPRIYWGSYIATTDYISLINGLQYSQLASTRNGSFTANPGLSEYIYYAVPSSFGSAILSVGDIVGGIECIASSIMITNSYGITIPYDIYKSDNVGLGQTTVVVN